MKLSIAMKTPTAPAARLEALEATIEHGLETCFEVGESLLEIRDQELWEKAGYTSFDAYCIKRWDFRKAYANFQINAAKTRTILTTIVAEKFLPKTETQARAIGALAKKDPQAAAKVLQKLGPETTAAKIEAAVQKLVPPKTKPQPSKPTAAPKDPEDPFRLMLAQALDGLQAWAATYNMHDLRDERRLVVQAITALKRRLK